MSSNNLGGSMSKIGIILLSDLHLRNIEVKVLSKITRALVDDLAKLSEKHDIKFHFLFLAGDLIYSGLESSNLFEVILQNLVKPIVNRFQIDKKNIISIPGNHEINRNNIDKITQLGLDSLLNSEGLDGVEYYSQIQKKLQEYFDFDKSLDEENKCFIVDNKIVDVGKIKFGITRVNTVWNLHGDSEKDVKNIWVPKIQLSDAFDAIKDANIKICFMHHPIDWIHDKSLYNIEPILDKYNIVLNGHKHYHKSSNLNNVNYIQSRKLGPITSESGYILLAVDSEESKLYKFHRNYISKSEDFRIAVEVTEDEYIKSDITIMDEDNNLVLNTIRESKINFSNSLYKLFVNAQKEDNSKSFDQFFTIPKLRDNRNPENDEKMTGIDLQSVVECEENLIIQGTEKSGKTILAHYFAKQYYERKWDFLKVPIYINVDNLKLKNNNEITNQIFELLSKLFTDGFEIKKSEFKRLLVLGKLFLIFDNCNDKFKLDRVYNFINEYKSCRYMILRNSRFGYFIDEETINIEINNDEIKFITYEILPLTKNDVRQLYKKISPSEKQSEIFFDKVMKDMDTIGLTRTPFNASLLLFIYNNDLYSSPSNQTKVIEQFLETILGKLNPEDQYYSNYDFENKEDFLANLANVMLKNGKYSINKSSFNEFVTTYHQSRGFDLEQSMFDKLFFDKMILINYNGNVCFRFEFMFHYYLAKYALKDKKVYEKILKDYVNFDQEVIHISGLRRDDKKLLKVFIDLLENELQKYPYSDNLIETDDVTNSFFKSYNELKLIIERQNCLPEDEIDNITDAIPAKSGYNPSLDIIEYDSTEIEKLSTIIRIAANIVKNIDNIDEIKLKERAVSCILDGIMRLWNINKIFLVNFLSKMDEEKYVSDLIKKGLKPEEVREKYNQDLKLLRSLFTIAIPIAVEMELYYQITSQKLNSIIKCIRDKQPINKPEQLIMQLLSADMQLDDWHISIKEYIQKTGKSDYLRVLFFKLSYVLTFGKANGNMKEIKQLQTLIAQKITGDKALILNDKSIN